MKNDGPDQQEKHRGVEEMPEIVCADWKGVAQWPIEGSCGEGKHEKSGRGVEGFARASVAAPDSGAGGHQEDERWQIHRSAPEDFLELIRLQVERGSKKKKRRERLGPPWPSEKRRDPMPGSNRVKVRRHKFFALFPTQLYASRKEQTLQLR